MTIEKACFEAPRAQGVYSRTYIEQWLDSLSPKSFTARIRREFLTGSRGLEIGEMSYRLEVVGEDQFKVHCVNTEEYKRLFSILDEASDRAGFAPRWLFPTFLALAGAAFGVTVMGLFVTAATAQNDVPSWASALLTSVAGIGGAVYGYFKGRNL